MIFIRRLPSLLYTYKYGVYFTVILCSTVIYLAFRWNLFCSDFQAWQQVNEMCKKYEQVVTVGSLCALLCNDRSMTSIKCHTYSSSKEAVFSVDRDNTRLTFKAVPTDIKSLHWFENGVIKYPSEKEFRSIVQAVVRKKFNTTLPQDDLNSLIHLRPSSETRSVKQRENEMDHIWTLVQDNEYLLLVIHGDKGMFPRVLGTCGSYFATEYLEPLREVPLFSFDDNKGNWALRLKMAIQILEFLEEFESSFREPYYLCDMKPSDFAIDKLTNKLKITNVDGIFPHSILNTIFSNIHSCEKDEECTVFDCKSKCLKPNKQCERHLLNSNLQIICLLMSEHTPSALASVLRQCANLQHDNQNIRTTVEEDLRDKIINILGEIDQNIDNEIFG